MNDLISRQALCEYALNQKDKSVTPNDIMRFPSAQPEQAQWVQMLINHNLYKCSNCQIAWNKRLVFENEGYSEKILMRYCPRCGRKMQTEVIYED